MANSNTTTMNGLAGKRKGASSPTTSTLPLPTSTYTTPKSKSATPTSRNTNNNNTSRSRAHPTSPTSRMLAQGKARKQSANQRIPISIDDTDSDLTPQSSDNENDTTLQMEEDLTPRRAMKHAAIVAKNADKKGKGKEKQVEPVKEKKTVKATGPGGRVRKRANKLEETERRRARDAKFDVGSSLGMASTQTLPTIRDIDETSSFGDDESDHGKATSNGHVGDVDDMMTGLPEALAGQAIEDLAYGAGSAEFELERGGAFGTGWWSSSDDEEEEEDGIYIDHLSGSEDERQSVSTSHNNDSDVIMSDSDDFSSSSEDEVVDEFGFPLHSTAPMDPMGPPDRPLILMENWKGELELVQPRQERSRSRRGDRGSTSRTAGSIGDSTVVSGDQELRIDPDEDASDASSWSGLSEEEGDDGGDTTDSMAEEDMPMLDSPALQQLIGEQIGHLDVNSIPSPVEPLGPSIVVTDTSMPALLPETPALSTTSSTPNFPLPAAPPSPSTPGSVAPPHPHNVHTHMNAPPPPPAPAPGFPQMGTFHPAIDDPAQCAVIDGTKTATKSPFTHKRRDVHHQRKNSITSSRAASLPERKRKSSMDIFSPNVVSSPKINKLPKKARYSSIPGHPRYVKAQRAAEAEEDGERATTPSDSDPADGDLMLSLEDMIETSVLVHESANDHDDGDNEHLRHLIRFDRVPVSTYLRRNIMSSGGRVDRTISFNPHHHPHPHQPDEYADHSTHQHHLPQQAWSSPVGRGYGMTDTLAGPVNGRGMLVSPILAPVGEDDEEEHATSRKERRKMKRRGVMPPPLQL